MKINEVEAQVGITKKNIRFYEEQGLLSPRRNSENGYRDYGPEEVAVLKQIKLLRKLGLPLEEIRRMQAGGTVADGMRRHLVTLEREHRDLEQSMELCRTLKTREVRLADLDAAALLEEMESMEKEGTTFRNKQAGDVKARRYVAPVVVAALIILFIGAIAALIWGVSRDEPVPPVLLVVLVVAAVFVIAGVLLALFQRIREINRGEIDDAKFY